MSKDVTESLGIHPVMLYRWQMKNRNGELRENKAMTTRNPSPKRRPDRADPAQKKDDELKVAKKRIQQLANREDELDLLKKAKRFFTKIK